MISGLNVTKEQVTTMGTFRSPNTGLSSDSDPGSETDSDREFETFHQINQTPTSPIAQKNPFLTQTPTTTQTNMSNQPGTSTVASMIATQQKPQELKLGQPPAFDGDPAKARGWFNNAQLYLLVNKDIYNDDDRKIAFALSFMREGSTALWALTETEAAFKQNPPSFGTWQDFLDKFSASFILENTKEQAIAWMTTTKVDKKIPLMDYIFQFKSNTALSEINNEDVLINFFSRGIPPSLMKRIYGMDTVPTTIDKWYQTTLCFQHVWEKTNEIVKGRPNPFHNGQQRQHNNGYKKDPNAMDVDAIQLSEQEQKRRFREGLCYKCGGKGHISKGCKNPFAKKEGKRPGNTKPEVSAKIEEIPDSDEEPMVGAISAQDF